MKNFKHSFHNTIIVKIKFLKYYLSPIYIYFSFLGFVIAQSIPAKKFKKSYMIKDEVLATITIIFLFLAVFRDILFN